MRTHEIDLFTIATTTAYGAMRAIPGYRFALTQIHGASTLLTNTTSPPLRDVRVRRAIAMAIDARALVSRLTFGAATVASADLPPFMWARDASLRAVSYDPTRARALLRGAGYVPGAGGILERDGAPLSLVLAFASTSATQRLESVQLQAYLRAVGIDAQLKSFTAQQIYAPFAMGGIFQTGKFDLATYTMTLGIDPDSSGRFMCDAVPPSGQNYSRYCSAQVDAAERQALASYDRGVRTRAYATVQQRLLDDVPLAFLWYPDNIDAYNTDLHGFHPNPTTASWNAADWSI